MSLLPSPLLSCARASRAWTPLMCLALAAVGCSGSGSRQAPSPAVAMYAADGGLPGAVAVAADDADGGETRGVSAPGDAGASAAESSGSEASAAVDAAAVAEPAELDADAARLAQGLAEALCASLRACLGEQKLNAFVHGEVCDERLSASLAQEDASAAPCHLALPSQCPAGEYCSAADVTTQGECRALPTEGQPCVLGSECAGGHVCLEEDSAGVCRRIRDLGEDCSRAALCRSGRCQRGQCRVSEVCG